MRPKRLRPGADYDAFLASKALRVPETGLPVVPKLAPHLFDYQASVVGWALRRGRAAIFLGTGLGKTLIELEWARHVARHACGPVLILAPLAVAQQTVAEGERWGVPVKYAREQAECAGDDGISITNYERLDNFDPSAFAGVVLDESGILKALDGKTRARLISAFAATPYRLACSATPSPNDHTELGGHAEFLGVMTTAEMKAQFFV
ncbi:MAG TPA: SNF2-related protein, partial [Polyangiaceae bacterium]|nr:SNF2-related protein [Polyangiaceae bacterium]